MAVLARLTISLSILDKIRVAQADDEQPVQWSSQGTYAGFVWMDCTIWEDGYISLTYPHIHD